MRILFVFSCSILFFACSSGNDVPGSVLPPKKMEAVFWDMFRADELAAQYKLTDTSKSLLQLHTELYDQVFSLHKISREEFNSSFRFYQSRPDLFKPMLESLTKRSDKALK
jgi:hypothetical protein